VFVCVKCRKFSVRVVYSIKMSKENLGNASFYSTVLTLYLPRKYWLI